MSALDFRYSRPSDNLLATLTPTITVTSGTVESGYGSAFLADYSDDGLGHPMRFTTTFAIILIDFLVPVSAPFVNLWHNFMEGLDVRVQANSIDDWSDYPPIDQAITIAAKRRNGYTRKAWAALADVDGNSTYRYWRIVIPENDVNVGLKLWLGTLRSIAMNFDPDDGVAITTHSVRTSAHTDTGFGWHYAIPASVRGVQGNITVERSEGADLDALYDEAGPAPIVIIFDPQTQESMIVRFVNAPTPFGDDGLVSVAPPVSLKNGYEQRQLSFLEVTAGGPEWD